MLLNAKFFKLDIIILKYEYLMNGIKLSEVKIEKDIGVKVSHDLKPSIHCLEAVKTILEIDMFSLTV